MDADLTDLFEGDATTVAVDERVVPHRVYAFYTGAVPSPAVYVEVVDGEETVPVIVHNFRDYGHAMDRWGLAPAELVALNELHELTHWAMTDEERTYWDRRAQAAGRADGDWLNPHLVRIIRDLAGRDVDADRSPDAGGRADGGGPSLFARLRQWLGG